MLERARLAMRARRYGDRTIVVHKPPPQTERLGGGRYLVDGELVGEARGGWADWRHEGGPVGPIEIRPGGRILKVY